jgi:hypothetical protein
VVLVLLNDAVHPAPAPSEDSVGHVLLTRFNLRIFRDRRDLANESGYVRWLRHRINAFEQTCLPSVVRQKRRPDLWLLGLDGERPDLVADVLTMIEPYPFIQPAWQLPGVEASDASAASIISLSARVFKDMIVAVAGGFEYLATTRLDNDDALATLYFQEIDQYIRAVLGRQPDIDDFWLAFPYGVQLADAQFYLYPHSKPHFLTRVSRDLQAEETALSINHSQLWADPGRQVFSPLSSHPMWLQNVHAENLLNKELAGGLALGPYERIAARFGMAS